MKSVRENVDLTEQVLQPKFDPLAISIWLMNDYKWLLHFKMFGIKYEK